KTSHTCIVSKSLVGLFKLKFKTPLVGFGYKLKLMFCFSISNTLIKLVKQYCLKNRQISLQAFISSFVLTPEIGYGDPGHECPPPIILKNSTVLFAVPPLYT